MPIAWIVVAGRLAVTSLILVMSGCATTGSAASGGSGRGSTGGGYEVREATEASDTDGLEVKLEEGSLNQEDAQAAIMRRFKDLTRCYQEAGAAMGFADGAVSLRFVVDARGSANEVRVLDTRLGNFAVEQCLVTVGRSIAFPRPRGASTANVDYTLEFRSSGELPVVDLPAGELDGERATLLARLGSECEQLGADEVLATVYVDAAGAVRSAGLASASSLDRDAARCVSAALSRWTASATALHAPALGRVTFSLRNAELVAAREAPRPVARRNRRKH